jgi:rod shape-determining protein MreD
MGNIRYLYWALNTLVLFVFAILCLIFQSTLLHECFGIFKPNLIIIILSYLALNRFAMEGGIMAFLLGYCVELGSGAPFGLYSSVFVLVFYSAKFICEGFYIHTLIAQMSLVVVTTVLSKAYLLLVLSVYESSAGVVVLLKQATVSILPIVSLNFLLTPLLFVILKNIDRLIYRELPSKTGSKESKIKLYS